MIFTDDGIRRSQNQPELAAVPHCHSDRLALSDQ
jgi:hypothetical protein